MRRQDSFPWIIVMGGAVLYWTIALGIGIPSLYRLLGPVGPAAAHHGAPVETRCVQAMSIDGKAIVFGECFNVRFVTDQPEAVGSFTRTVEAGSDETTGPDDGIETPTENGTLVDFDVHSKPADSVGRTSY